MKVTWYKLFSKQNLFQSQSRSYLQGQRLLNHSQQLNQGLDTIMLAIFSAHSNRICTAATYEYFSTCTQFLDLVLHCLDLENEKDFHYQKQVSW